ncbi:MAG: formylmethanofuran--tetrahydromethanopterin N-formyltransferase [Promethearchaeia archaeon]
MELNGVKIEDTFCEAFGNKFTRVLVTAINQNWLETCAQIATGYGTSTIHCDAEAGIDMFVDADDTPDNRPGVILMYFMNGDQKKVNNTLMNRLGQCVLTCPTTACFDAFDKSLKPEKEFELKAGYNLKFFGDGYEEEIDDFPFAAWKIPVMDGEFIIQSVFKGGKGVAGGNFLIVAEDQESGLKASEKAIEAIDEVEYVITPFPGGIVRSGSKVGSKYKFLNASTNDPLCPTLKDQIENTQLEENEDCVYEIIIDGATEEAVKKAIKVGIEASVQVPRITKITAGNYGGELGKYQYNLHDVLSIE